MRKVLYIFGALTDGDIAWMARVGTRRRLSPGDVVIAEGAPVSFVVILLEGLFSVTVAGIGEVARLQTGEIVGEMSYVDSAPPSATVTAVEPCLALFIDRTALSQKVAEDAGFGLRFYRALAVFLAARLRDTVRRLGYGETGSLDGEAVMEDELDMAILDTVSMAGDRFTRMLKILSGVVAS